MSEPPAIPFPQADSISKVFDTMAYVALNPDATDNEIADWMAVDSRQGGYYANACAYLGLIERQRILHQGNTLFNRLTAAGQEYISLPNSERNKFIIKAMARHKVFNICLSDVLDGKELSKPYVIALLEKYAIGMDKGTPSRRASTVIGWCNWVKSILKTDTK